MQPDHPTQNQIKPTQADSAAILGIALSLYEASVAQARAEDANLSEAYQGYDQFMREVMRVAHEFELWACEYVNFGEFGEVWPYFLQDHFGPACVSVVSARGLAGFGGVECLRVAPRLGIPIRIDSGMPVPICAESRNPIAGSEFLSFRIQTVRDSIDGDTTCAYTWADEPFDEEYYPPYVSLYGVRQNGLLEHIASRRTYDDAIALARALAPGTQFIATPRPSRSDTSRPTHERG